MSLRERLQADDGQLKAPDLFGRFGVLANPFPASSQTADNPHFQTPADAEVETRVLSFLRDGSSQVVVIEGTQGVGKTNLLNHFAKDIQEALSDQDGYYVVRYLADPEQSFEGTIRKLFQELGTDHFVKLAEVLQKSPALLSTVRGPDLRAALSALSQSPREAELQSAFLGWLLGLRLLKVHRERLQIQFRLDTVESKTSALRDIIVLSSDAKLLNGIFLLLDELEKQDGVLGPTAIVRYLSAMRAIIDALPKHLFMMIAVTPDAMRRYSVALPAFRSRLQNQVTLHSMQELAEAATLANSYVAHARQEAKLAMPAQRAGAAELVTPEQIETSFLRLKQLAERRGDVGVRQREFLHQLHDIAEEKISTPSK